MLRMKQKCGKIGAVRQGGVLLAILAVFVIAGCQGPTWLGFGNESDGSCGAIIDWVDFLKWDDIQYVHNDEGTGPVAEGQLGEKLGEISFMLDEHACSGYRSKNGDAAYLPIGTAIYVLKGYKSEFRVVADNKVYEVSDNPKAQTMGDLLDIDRKVEKVGLDSGIDGSAIGDFSPEASTAFIEELLPLKHVGFDKVYEKTMHESGVFLRVYLIDGTSFRMVFYPKANAFTAGAFGTEQLKELIMTERARIKAAAGM